MSRKSLLFVVLAFLISVFVGITGSSLRVAQNWDVVSFNQKVLLGHERGIRSDEWGVVTALCLSQMHHKPPFPIVNKTIDVSGKNMLIVHDFGVPVRHVSAIARPATWGYFTGNIRFGMSWNWMFPLFLGFVGISLLLNELLGRFKENLWIAGAIVFAPICAAWSNFPLYELGAGSLATYATLRILQSDGNWQKWFFALLTAWSAAVFALTLYLPRLIPMAIVFLTILAIIVWNKDLTHKVKSNGLYLIGSFVFFAYVMSAWYLDAQEAIHTILGSSFPGARVITGGSFTIWDSIRGWFAYPLVLRNVPFSNQSELSAFPDLLCIGIPLVLFYWKEFSGNKKLFLALVAVLLFLLSYQYIGFTSLLAQLTGLSKSHPPRIVSSVLIIELAIVSYFLINLSTGEIRRDRRLWCFSMAISLFVIELLFFSCSPSNRAYIDFLTKSYKYLLICLISFLFVAFFVCFRISYKQSAPMIFLVFAIPGLLFNPISKAPRKISSNLPEFITCNQGTDQGRILFLTGSQWESNSANIVGIPSLGGVHHYMDRYMYDHFYAHENDGTQFNRFNHTVFSASDGRTTQIGIPWPDVIEWKVSPKSFDFGKLPIQYVVALREYDSQLSENLSVRKVETNSGSRRFVYYEIKR